MALLNHEETIAFLTQKKIADDVWMQPKKRYAAKVKLECGLCGAEMQIADTRFVTEAMRKNPESLKCPICGETMICTSYDITTRD